MATQSRVPVPISVLLTRPAAQGARFAARLEAAFPGQLACVTAPLMAPVWVEDPVPARDWTAILLTSETGAEAALRRRVADRLPGVALCVGRRTAEVAGAGFATQVAEGDVEALLALARGSGLPGPMLHLRGRDSRGDLAARLTAAGIETAELVVYDQQAQPLGPEAVALLHGSGPVIVPVFSPRSARLLRAEHQRMGASAPLHLAALSPAVAAELQALPHIALAVAAAPDAAAMQDAVGQLLDNLRRS